MMIINKDELQKKFISKEIAVANNYQDERNEVKVRAFRIKITS